MKALLKLDILLFSITSMYDTPIFPEVFASFTTDISVETHIVFPYFTRHTHGTNTTD